ncbi:MAG TPA: GAF domain-containing protein [Chloroflexota bacterium]|nr:GAF domain-containing protein [Chloroflexota bacterium]
MSLWPILQPRRRNDEHVPLTPIPEPLQAGESLSAAGSFERTATLILRQTIEVTGAGSSVIFRLDPSAEHLSSLVVLAGDQAITIPELSCTPGEGLAGRAAFERRVIWTGNALEDRQAGDYWKDHAALLGEGRRAAMAAPLSFGGELFGALQVGYVAMRTFRANELSEFGKLASFAATALENARLHDITVRGARQLRLLHDVAARLAAAERVTSLHRRLTHQNARQEVLLREQEQLSATLAETAEARGRLEGVTLAAREIVHLLSNDLAVAVGAIELMRLQADLTPNALIPLRQAETGLNAADHHLRSLQRVVRVRTKETPIGPALDLARSTTQCG